MATNDHGVNSALWQILLYDPLKLIEGITGPPDPRTNEWVLIRSPWPTAFICLSYVYFVKYWGPNWMHNRKPFEIRWLMVAYNFFMVILSTAMFVYLGVYGWFGKYNLFCQPVDYSKTGDAMTMAHIAWWYYISKYIEFNDTVFFVLRKKFTHVSNLHVIHHGIMPMSVWWGVKFTPGGHSSFFAFINSAVHIMMYIYYGMAAIGPHMSKYLFWKKHMTSIQMVQFVMIFMHSFQLLFWECDYPKSFMWWIGFHAVLFWFLFWNFYKETYLVRMPAQKKNADNGKHKSNPTGTTFFACTPTESLINGMNKEMNGAGGKQHENGEARLVQRKPTQKSNVQNEQNHVNSSGL